jgi:hypothetical protein
MTEAQAKRILREQVRRAASINKVDFRDLCHPKQLAFVEDASPLVAAVCGRQCGKTHAMALKALDTANRHPRSQVLYITLSRPAAKRNFWPKLLMLDRELELGAKFNHAELTMTLDNGSTILLGGANDDQEIERYRGMSIPLAILDEAQAFRPYIENLVKEILRPACIAYNGQIAMIGTPNPGCHGFFFDATTGPTAGGWSVHRWTAYDNPFLPDPVAFIEEEKRLNHYTDAHPIFRREWLGEWVKNSEGTVYNIPPFALVQDLPEAEDWVYTLGIDVGFVDASAFVVMAYSATLGQAAVVASHQREGMIPSAIAAEVERIVEEYDCVSVVIDPGGGGKFVVEELVQKYAVPAKVAQKRAKMAAIDQINGDFRSGTLMVVSPANADLLHDASLLLWDRRKLDRKKGHFGGHTPSDHLMIDDRTPDHLLDAMLYAYRETRAHLWDRELAPPKHGSPDWFRAQEQELMDQAIAKAERAHPPDEWWEA